MKIKIYVAVGTQGVAVGNSEGEALGNLMRDFYDTDDKFHENGVVEGTTDKNFALTNTRVGIRIDDEAYVTVRELSANG